MHIKRRLSYPLSRDAFVHAKFEIELRTSLFEVSVEETTYGISEMIVKGFNPNGDWRPTGRLLLFAKGLQPRLAAQNPRKRGC